MKLNAWHFWVGIPLLLFLAFAGLLLWAHVRMKGEVEAYKRELIRQGDKLTYAELAPPVSEAAVASGTRLLAQPRRNMTNVFYIIKLVAPGRAMVAWQQPQIPGKANSNLWDNCAEECDDLVADGFNPAALAAWPRYQFRVNYDEGFNARLTHLAPLKSLAGECRSGAMVGLRRGQFASAYTNWLATIHLAGGYEPEAFLISSLVRNAMAAIAFGVTWEALHYPGWTEAQLAAVQREWMDVAVMDSLALASRGERAGMVQVVEEARHNPKLLDDLTGGPSNFSDILGASNIREATQTAHEAVSGLTKRACWPWWISYTDELFGLRQNSLGVRCAEQMRRTHRGTEALRDLEKWQTQLLQEIPLEQGYLAGQLSGATDVFLRKFVDVETQRQMAITALALQRYKLRHGAYPAALSDLLPAFLAEVPQDLWDGQPLRYRLQSDGTFLLYSVGRNGKDDQGNPAMPVPGNLPRFLEGLDMVWPQPASPAELERAFKDKRLFP